MTRNNSMDLLRIISCFTVILLHINYYYFGNIYESISFDKIYLVESFINVITRFSVPCFIMISGAFILSNGKNSDFKSFYKKSFIKIFFPLLFLIFILSLFFLVDTGFSIRILFDSFFHGYFYNTWFMAMLLFLYILTPFIIIIKKNVSNKTFIGMAIFFLLWGFIFHISSSDNIPFSGNVVISFLGYYLIGNVLYEKFLEKKSSISLYMLISFLMVVITHLYRLFIKVDYRYSVGPYTNSFSPTIMLFSISTFCLFCNLKIKNNFFKLSNYTFYIYIFHTIIYQSIFRYFSLTHNQFINIFIVTVLTFILSLLLSIGFKWFWGKYIVVKKCE